MIVLNRDEPLPPQVQWFSTAFRAIAEEGRMPMLNAGADDPLIPAENSRRIAERIPGAQLAVLPDTSHFFWIEKPRETADALIRFFGALS